MTAETVTPFDAYRAARAAALAALDDTHEARAAVHDADEAYAAACAIHESALTAYLAAIGRGQP